MQEQQSQEEELQDANEETILDRINRLRGLTTEADDRSALTTNYKFSPHHNTKGGSSR